MALVSLVYTKILQKPTLRQKKKKKDYIAL